MQCKKEYKNWKKSSRFSLHFVLILSLVYKYVIKNREKKETGSPWEKGVGPAVNPYGVLFSSSLYSLSSSFHSFLVLFLFWHLIFFFLIFNFAGKKDQKNQKSIGKKIALPIRYKSWAVLVVENVAHRWRVNVLFFLKMLFYAVSGG